MFKYIILHKNKIYIYRKNTVFYSVLFSASAGQDLQIDFITHLWVVTCSLKNVTLKMEKRIHK